MSEIATKSAPRPTAFLDSFVERWKAAVELSRASKQESIGSQLGSWLSLKHTERDLLREIVNRLASLQVRWPLPTMEQEAEIKALVIAARAIANRPLRDVVDAENPQAGSASEAEEIGGCAGCGAKFYTSEDLDEHGCNYCGMCVCECHWNLSPQDR